MAFEVSTFFSKLTKISRWKLQGQVIYFLHLAGPFIIFYQISQTEIASHHQKVE